MTVGHDDNIFESADFHTSDLTGRLHFSFTGSGRMNRHFIIQTDGQIGLEGYSQYTIETRALCDLNTKITTRILPTLHISALLRFRAKKYFSADKGYRMPLYRLETTVYPSPSWVFAIYAQQSNLDYSLGQLYDHKQREGGLSIRWAANRRLQWQINGVIGKIRYDRQAFEWLSNDELNTPWIYHNDQQSDRYWQCSIWIEYYKNMLLRFTAGYERVTSNSTGFNYRQPMIDINAAREIVPGFLINLKWIWKGKRYDDPLNPSLQLRPDTETEDMNMAVIDLSRELNSAVTATFRVGWYENESPYRNRYYQKTVCTLGLLLRF